MNLKESQQDAELVAGVKSERLVAKKEPTSDIERAARRVVDFYRLQEREYTQVVGLLNYELVRAKLPAETAALNPERAPKLLYELLAHIEWMKGHGEVRITQTRDSVELNAFNHGRVDAAESLQLFYADLLKNSTREAATPSPAPEQMAKSRKVFHVEAERLGWSIERYEDGTYMDDCTDDGWQLWQAAIEFKGSHE